ncbi:MAG: hypothetical protein ACOYK6_07845 [Chthoniobacterales bacterium]
MPESTESSYLSLKNIEVHNDDKDRQSNASRDSFSSTSTQHTREPFEHTSLAELSNPTRKKGTNHELRDSLSSNSTQYTKEPFKFKPFEIDRPSFSSPSKQAWFLTDPLQLVDINPICKRIRASASSLHDRLFGTSEEEERQSVSVNYDDTYTREDSEDFNTGYIFYNPMNSNEEEPNYKSIPYTVNESGIQEIELRKYDGKGFIEDSKTAEADSKKHKKNSSNNPTKTYSSKIYSATPLTLWLIKNHLKVVATCPNQTYVPSRVIQLKQIAEKKGVLDFIGLNEKLTDLATKEKDALLDNYNNPKQYKGIFGTYTKRRFRESEIKRETELKIDSFISMAKESQQFITDTLPDKKDQKIHTDSNYTNFDAALQESKESFKNLGDDKQQEVLKSLRENSYDYGQDHPLAAFLKGEFDASSADAAMLLRRSVVDFVTYCQGDDQKIFTKTQDSKTSNLIPPCDSGQLTEFLENIIKNPGTIPQKKLRDDEATVLTPTESTIAVARESITSEDDKPEHKPLQQVTSETVTPVQKGIHILNSEHVNEQVVAMVPTVNESDNLNATSSEEYKLGKVESEPAKTIPTSNSKATVKPDSMLTTSEMY